MMFKNPKQTYMYINNDIYSNNSHWLFSLALREMYRCISLLLVNLLLHEREVFLKLFISSVVCL